MNALQEKAADAKARERTRTSVLRQLAALQTMTLDQLRDKWLDLYGAKAPKYKKGFLIKRLAYRIQELYYSGLSEQAKAHLQKVAANDPVATFNRRIPDARKTKETILPGTRMIRIWNNRRYEVIAQTDGFVFEGRIFKSLSAVAREITGTRWNGKLFFGLKKGCGKKRKGGPMRNNIHAASNKTLHCAIYTRKSHEEGLEQEFNSLDAQCESAEAYIESQKLLGWKALPECYDDGGYSGGTMERPALKRLLADIDAGKIDIIVVYKIDRLSRAAARFYQDDRHVQ